MPQTAGDSCMETLHHIFENSRLQHRAWFQRGIAGFIAEMVYIYNLKNIAVCRHLRPIDSHSKKLRSRFAVAVQIIYHAGKQAFVYIIQQIPGQYYIEIPVAGDIEDCVPFHLI